MNQEHGVVPPFQSGPYATSESASPPRVLVADDDMHIRKLLELSLENDGYTVLSASDGHELVQLAQQYTPNLILVDLMMPRMDGYEAIRQMRNDTRIAHIPMIILTARQRPDEIVTGFETGADDYIGKPFDINEVLARVRSHLRRAARQPQLNPLSGLPGGMLIKQELEARFMRGQPLTLLHADLDNFKTFNDTYGFSRGDRAIIVLGQLLQQTIALYGDGNNFIGHVGGDDFVVLTTPDVVEQICEHVIARFNEEVRQFYKPEEWQRGYISGIDRFGILRRFNLLSLSIGGTSNHIRSFESAEEMAQVAAEVKQYAKTQTGSSFAIDQRTMQQARPIDRRAGRTRRILLVSDDASLRAVLQSTLQHANNLLYEVESIAEARTAIADAAPVLLIIDAQLGHEIEELCDEIINTELAPQILIITHDQAPRLLLPTRHVTMLQIPLPLSDIVACVEQLTLPK